jgi:hypothetical protein
MGIEANFLGEISTELLCPICSFVFDKPATNCKEVRLPPYGSIL